MRWMRRGNRKALKALVLSFAAMAILAGNANAAQVNRGSIDASYEKGGVRTSAWALRPSRSCRSRAPAKAGRCS